MLIRSLPEQHGKQNPEAKPAKGLGIAGEKECNDNEYDRADKKQLFFPEVHWLVCVLFPGLRL
jgi:hypothetical protein